MNEEEKVKAVLSALALCAVIYWTTTCANNSMAVDRQARQACIDRGGVPTQLNGNSWLCVAPGVSK